MAPTKDDRIDQARASGVEVDSKDTKAQIEEKLAAAGVSLDDSGGGEPADGIRSAEQLPPAIGTPEGNAELEHSEDPDATTTRADRLDAGVPMLQGDKSEPVGPEDAAGVGPKRGDYRGRVGLETHTSVALPDGGDPILGDDGQVVDYKPRSALVPQAPRAEDIGEVAGKKGGVTTAPEKAIA